MQGKWSRCLSGVGGAVLIGGLVLANYGGGVAPAEAHDQQKQSYNHPNPFRQILDKLNEVLEKLKNGGGGGAAGNYTMRWDTNKPSVERFTMAFPGAVLDNNTGLVWEQAPEAPPPVTSNWSAATAYCVNKEVGNTGGWRLPSVVELKSVQDASPGAVAPFVPGNVFTGVQSSIYWSATTMAGTTSFTSTSVWSVSFEVDGKRQAGQTPKGNSAHVWCVRGPMSESVY